MEKHVYLLVTDLHLSVATKENRYSYASEMMGIKEVILQTIAGYKRQGYKVSVVFLGDLFDRGYRDCLGCTLDQNYFIALRNQVKDIYAVVGNHELTYKANNPFYTLFTQIESNKMSHLRPTGVMDTIRIVDLIEDGNLAIHFNHYGTAISTPIPGKINVGLGHQDLCCNEILEDVRNTFGFDVFDGSVVKYKDGAFFEGYQYYYCAHFHKIYGAYLIDTPKGKCKIQHLGSLGRPHHDEVQDNFLERDIPALIVEDGKFKEEQHNFLYLPDRVSCVKEAVVVKQQNIRKHAAAMKKATNYKFNLDHPIDNVRTILRSDPVATSILESTLADSPNELLQQLDQKIWEVCNE